MMMSAMVIMVMMMMVQGTSQVWAKCGPGVDPQVTDCGLSPGLYLVCRLVYTCSTSGTNSNRYHQHEQQHCGGCGRRRGRPLHRHRRHRHLRRQVIIIIAIATIIFAIAIILNISIIIIILQYRNGVPIDSPINEIEFSLTDLFELCHAYPIYKHTYLTCQVQLINILRMIYLTFQVHVVNVQNIRIIGKFKCFL